ncbi:MAG: hypothetical protein NXI24_21995 [bacterium]|nr:hypothetical protein [bacterium]
MAHKVSDQHRAEVEKILKYLKNMEGIVRTSPNPEQKARVQKELSKQRTRLAAIVPGLDATRMNHTQIVAALEMSGGEAAGAAGASAAGGGSTARAAATSSGAGTSGGYKVLDKFPIEKASPNSTDPDVNFLAGVFTAIQKEYWPAISEQHCQMDFSRGAERGAMRTQLDNVLRNMKVLLETIEEYSSAEQQDFREQLLKMKNRQTRAFIFDANDMLRKIRDFMEPLLEDIEVNGGIITNKTETLRFNARYEDATVLEGAAVADGVQEFARFVQEAIEHLNLPQLKKKEPHER